MTGSLYEIDCEPEHEPGPGRRRAAITVKKKGVIVFHKAGPSNIVLGLYMKWLQTPEGQDYARGFGQT